MTNTMIHTSAGTLYFDALIRADHTSNVTLTEHAVQVGAVVSDHAIIEPQEISLEIGMTDAVGGDGSSVRAYQQFQSLMKNREPCTVVTRIASYQNMVLTSMSVPDDYTTMNALRATLTFKEVRLVSIAKMKASNDVSSSKTVDSSNSSKTGLIQIIGKTGSITSNGSFVTSKQFSSAVSAAIAKANANGQDSAAAASAAAKAQAMNNAKTAVAQVSSKATVSPNQSVLTKAFNLLIKE